MQNYNKYFDYPLFSCNFVAVKLSIIIPVYKTEATLNRCLDSIVGQQMGDSEIILVDDGSPDGASALCDEWAQKDSRIRVIHKSNGGLSDARNAGLDMAKGEYVTFVDSDDYLATDSYERVMKAMNEDCDIMEFPIFTHYGSKRQLMVSMGQHVFRDAKNYWLNGRAYEHSYACNKIFRRHLFDGTRFPVGRVFEDMGTLPLLVRKARLIQTTDQGCYYYTENPEGITNTASGQELAMLLEAHLAAMKQWDDDRYYMHVLNIQLDVTRMTGAKPMLQPRHVSLSTSGMNQRLRIKALLLNILGINALCYINKLTH